MRIAFHIDNLSFRGTTTAVKDYAFYNEKLLNNKSFIFLDKSIKYSEQDENYIHRMEVLNRYKSLFDVIEYSDINDFESKLQSNKCDYAYFLKAGFNDGIQSKSTKSLIHCVFNYNQPHGYKYSYVSRWLSEAASGNQTNYVPHIVDLPKSTTTDYREKLKINKDQFVIGRYGGFDQFDIEFAKQMVLFVAENDPNITFVFVNTRNFINYQHPRILFLGSIIDPQEKTDFISSCDAMIHARSDGESFGLSICEFLFHNKPVISFGGGRDKNNVELLKKYDLIYNNQYELLDKIFKLKYGIYKNCYQCIVKEYSPMNVMQKFEKIFLRN
jgi:glycosyltransferase involved in cell wall biosynthesis